MSLLGRLEDLSLTDIIQIVFLSRRTGILEIINDEGRHTVLFRNGMIVNASSPSSPTLAQYLIASGAIPAEMGATLSEAEESGVPAGNAVLEINILSPAELAAAVLQRVISSVTPLLSSKDGEFNFILSDSVGPLEIEYEVERVFREGGIPPQQILAGDGDKLRPLGGLEESMRAGKALLRGSAIPPTPSKYEAPPPGIEKQPDEESPEPFLEIDDDIASGPIDALFEDARAEAEASPEPFAEPFVDSDEAEPDDLDADSLTLSSPLPELEPAGADPAARAGKASDPATRFRVGSKADVTVEPLLGEWNVIVFERDPLVRVAVKRAFARRAVQIHQFSTPDDTRQAMLERLRENEFFVTFLDYDHASHVGADAIQLLQTVKRKNHHLPIAVVDREGDVRRRQTILDAGADMYLTKPSAAHLQPSLAEQQLALFADELVVFAERTYAQLRSVGGGSPDGAKRFYELAEQERVNRSYTLLRHLINELTNPDDFPQVVDTILRTAHEYVDRSLLLAVSPDGFEGLGGFGQAGPAGDLGTTAQQIRISRGGESVLEEVEKSGRLHRGKMRRTPGNVDLIRSVGDVLPTEVAVFPLVHGGRTIALLYGDNAEHRVPVGDVSGLEIFLYQAGFALQNALTARSQSGPSDRISR